MLLQFFPDFETHKAANKKACDKTHKEYFKVSRCFIFTLVHLPENLTDYPSY